MTSPDVTPRSFALLSATVLGWTIWLSYALKFFFGASMSSGWIMVGVLSSLVVIGAILMLNELVTVLAGHKPWEQPARPRPAKAAIPVRIKPVRKAVAPMSVARRGTAGAYRIALGLKPVISAANRRRTRFPSVRRVFWFQRS